MRLIDADKLIQDIKNCLWDWKSVDGITATTVLKQTITDIENQPTIPLKEQERKKGSWDYGTQCSVCKGTIIPPKDRKVRVNFCPWCGVDMRDSYEQGDGEKDG